MIQFELLKPRFLISFRTKYAQNEDNSEYKYSVSELAKRIETGCYGKPRTVKYLDNGGLVFNTGTAYSMESLAIAYA